MTKFLQKFDFRSSDYERPNQKWVCGRAAMGNPCRIGPDGGGQCRAQFECTPRLVGSRWECTRADSAGGACDAGPLPDGTCCKAIPRCVPVRSLRAKRGLVTRWAIGLTIGFLALVMGFAGGARLLMPGANTSVHGSLGDCNICHTDVAKPPFGWAGMIFASVDGVADSNKCLHCHMDKGTAMFPHGVAASDLAARTERIKAGASESWPLPQRVQAALFPVERHVQQSVPCATCHNEHKGEHGDLTRVADSACQACHVVRFANFSNGHPVFSNYPFRRRTRINFDHASHFTRYFPEAASDRARASAVPQSCNACHVTDEQARVMAVRSFDDTCAACHAGQITGEQRAIGPKGIPFIAIPGLDLRTLAERGAAIGEWPEFSEAKLTPFMRVLIARDERGRDLVERIGDLDLLDLLDAKDDQIKAVEALAWRVKELILDVATSKVSDLQERLAEATGDKPDSVLVARLIASMPRDVLVGMWRDWLPHLADDVARHKRGERVPIPGMKAVAAPKPAPAAPAAASKDQSDILRDDKKEDILGDDKKEDILSEGKKEDILGDDKKEDILSEGKKEDILGNDDKEDILSDEKAAVPAPAPREKVAEQTVAPEVDEEEWVAFGGWYRRDFQVLYRPTGHTDRFFRAWLDYSARLFGKPSQSLVEPIFDELTDKDAQGQCMKCHSVDKEPTGELLVKWRPTRSPRAGNFTKFSHGPHYDLPGNSGCVTCHALNPKANYQASYKGYDPTKFESNFLPLKQEVCAECHVEKLAGDSCQLCHSYHANEFSSPVMATRIPGIQK